ncbi:MAG: hypothetical protein ABL973_16620 [Micropepsaceae bacterium]
MLIEADLNSDGRITHAEVDEFAAKTFSKSDSNKNGSLDQAEFVAGWPLPPAGASQVPPGAVPPPMRSPEGAFKRADWNGDGKLTLEELAAPLRGMAVLADWDGDGVILKNECCGRKPPP